MSVAGCKKHDQLRIRQFRRKQLGRQHALLQQQELVEGESRKKAQGNRGVDLDEQPKRRKLYMPCMLSSEMP